MCNLKIYMHFGVCMNEHFDLITNQFKYTNEIVKSLYIRFEKLWWKQNWIIE
jgi:hypothetical protein